MQKKLRMRFLAINWSLLFVLFCVICAAVGYYMYQSEVSETEKLLRQAAEAHTLDNTESRGMVVIFADENGNRQGYEQKHISLSEDTINLLAEAVRDTGVQGIGMTEVNGTRYRYLNRPRAGGMDATIAECSRETALLENIRRSFGVFALLGGIMLVPVAMLLAAWVSRPIETAWEKQNGFVSDATHELKTPLATIAANTEAVLANPESSVMSQNRWLGSIRGETERMAELVANLLFLAKIDAGEIKLEVQEIDISELLEGFCMERETDIFESGRKFEYELTPDLKYKGDWKRIRQMTEELLGNAVQYTPKGGSIRMVVNRDRKLRTRIIVSNSGCPISQQDLPKIFDRFFRADPSRARSTGGYGLGLCVAKSIAELHGGEITAECRNEINVFTVILGNAEPKTDKIAKNPKKKYFLFGGKKA